MSEKKQQSKKTGKSEKNYTYPEFLREFFPNTKDESNADKKLPAINKEDFLDILEEITLSLIHI